MVIDGKAEVVGSNRTAANSAIDHAKQVAVMDAAVSATRENHSVPVFIGPGSGRARVLLAGYDGRHVTPVQRDENADHALAESNVVRGLATIDESSGAALALSTIAINGEHLAVSLEADDGAIIGVTLVGDVSVMLMHRGFVSAGERSEIL